MDSKIFYEISINEKGKVRVQEHEIFSEEDDALISTQQFHTHEADRIMKRYLDRPFFGFMDHSPLRSFSKDADEDYDATTLVYDHDSFDELLDAKGDFLGVLFTENPDIKEVTNKLVKVTNWQLYLAEKDYLCHAKQCSDWQRLLMLV